MGAGIGAATGAASGGLKGALVGAVGGAAGAAVKSFTGGAVNVGLSYSAENGFGASVGVGYGPATVSVGISERGGTSVDVGFNKAGFNAGLSYNSKTGSVSGSAGFTSQSSGTGFALSYSEGDGFGASLSKSFSNGLNGGLSWSEKGGVGGNIGYEAPGDKDKPKNSLANQMKGAGGTVSFSQRDGLSAALNASGGVNAGNWSQSGGFQANSNFLMDSWKADFVSKQGEIEELQSKGLSKEQATAILDAQAHAESKAAQEKNNQESGKSVLDGFGFASTRREGEDGSHGVIGFDDDGPTPAHGAPSSHDPGQTLASSGSFDPDGKPTGGRQLSAADVAEFKADWRKESPAQTDASIAGLKAAGYDTSGLEKFVNDYRNAKAANNSQVSTTTHPTQSTGFFTNAYNAVVGSASNLWDRVTGGSKPVTHQTAPVFELDNGAKLPFENQGSSYGRVRNLTRNDGTTYTSIPHSGLDQPQASGTPVPVVADGRVIALSRNYENNQNGGGYGAFVLVQHNNGIFTLYGHNSNVLVKVGDSVTRGQVISNVGNSGNSFGAHMHYEVRTGFNVNPRAYISQTTHQNPATFNWNQWIQDHPE
ncbi:M23 family metallopeptidase [Leptospira weilii]|uniref:M23 family metallopeptidase n=1 Tax=Leptospira weilii TaxID=28184 RepID=UPI001EF2B164|nr:M23 family metallopeptidase [Leptospira weilii]ULH30605.1 peptidoglycan DD-metalloendopeptidase family protein [Leptospira weilii]